MTTPDDLRVALGLGLTALAAAGSLALAVLAATRARKNPLAPKLALLCLDLFVFNAADLAWQLFGGSTWGWIDTIGSSLTVPLVLELVLAFTGRSQQHLRLRVAVWVWFTSLALSCAIPIFYAPAAIFHQSGAWAVGVLLGTVPVVSFVCAVLVQHRRSSIGDESIRATWVLVAIGIGALLGSTDLMASAGLPVIRMANVGMLAASLVLANVALRGRLIGELSPSDALKPILLASAAVGLYLSVLPYVAENVAVLAFSTFVFLFALLSGLQQILRARAEHQARLETLAFVGRMSAQLAHDIKNPLAALKGAAQFLVEELAHGRIPSVHGPMLNLIVDQANRLNRVADVYGRLGRLELSKTPCDGNEIIRQTLVPLARAAEKPGLEIEFRFVEGALPVEVDRDLLSAALENLFRNALESMPNGGSLLVRTIKDESSVVVEIGDSGIGMNPRDQARAFEDFFTTKASGSGLGLGLVRRVVAAHGGVVTLESRESRGTLASVSLPLRESTPRGLG